MAHVLDASALMAYFEKEPGYEKVQQLLTAAAIGDRTLLLSTVNWGEVYYVTHRTYGVAQANHIAHIIGTFPLEVVDVDIEMAKQAALFPETNPLLDEIEKLDVNSLSPIEALNKLFEWQKRFAK